MERWIIVTLAVVVVTLFTVAQVARLMRNRAVHATLRSVIDAGQPLTPDLVRTIDRAPEPRAVDERIGFVLIALALGTILAGAINDSGDLRDLAAVSMIPLLVGAALLLRVRLSRSRKADR